MDAERALEPIIESAGRVNERAGLHPLCERIADYLGARWYLFGLRVACTSFVEPEVILVDGYPEALMAVYRDRDYVLVDPAFQHGYQRVVPVYWSDLRNGAASDGPEYAVLRDLRAHGLLTGMSLPVHGNNGELSLLNLAWSEEGADVEADLRCRAGEAMHLAAYLHEAASRVSVNEAHRPPVEPLTRREQECLMWCAEGKTSWETAQILGISERTVIFHLQNVNVKLGVTSRQQAVARATVRGLILPAIRTLPDSR